MSFNLISNENEVFRSYAFWSGVLILKLLGMSLLTARQRFANKVPKLLLFKYNYVIIADFCFYSHLQIQKILNYKKLKLNLMTKMLNVSEGKNKSFLFDFFKIVLNTFLNFRAHRNDLENIIPLIFAGFFFVQTNPQAAFAINLFRAAAIFRIAHTIVYAVHVLPQPSRAIAFFVPLVITGYMAVKSLIYFL